MLGEWIAAPNISTKCQCYIDINIYIENLAEQKQEQNKVHDIRVTSDVGPEVDREEQISVFLAEFCILSFVASPSMNESRNREKSSIQQGDLRAMPSSNH